MTRMHTNEKGGAFRRRFFPTATAREWSDWRWQLRRSLRDANSLGRILRLTDDERARQDTMMVCVSRAHSAELVLDL